MWLRANGMMSGILDGNPVGRGAKGEGKGKIPNAPPPDAFQLILMYFCARCYGDEVLKTL